MNATEVDTLWNYSNALAIILVIITLFIFIFIGTNAFLDVKNVSKNWDKYRCSPTVMPLAWLYGFNTTENFNFCMGKVFSVHSTPFVGSFSVIIQQFVDLVKTLFDSISSLRNMIATMGGGINIIFQEFTERISAFFFQLRISAIQIKNLISRLYAILFSVMYMGMSGVTGVTTFTNTFMYSFLNTFCFPGNTIINLIGNKNVKIKDIKIGNIIDNKDNTTSIVTGTFKFHAKGQDIVSINDVVVSTNHYLKYNDAFIMAGEHPNAIKLGKWESDEPLYCLNTNNHLICINNITFLDYDETEEGDFETMNMIDNMINGTNNINTTSKIKEYASCYSKNTPIILKNNEITTIKNIKIGDILSTGATVCGVINRKIYEKVELNINNIHLSCSSSCLIWDEKNNMWKRSGELSKIISCDEEMVSLIVTPNSQFEIGNLINNIRVRDYMELCSPDSEIYYTKHLTN
jgi:hypothetical protein